MRLTLSFCTGLLVAVAAPPARTCLASPDLPGQRFGGGVAPIGRQAPPACPSRLSIIDVAVDSGPVSDTSEAIGRATPAQDPQTFHVGRIDATGVKRYTVAEVARVSGLAVGQLVAVTDIEAAAARMAATGLFTSVRYRYVTADGQVTVTFDVEEVEWGVPIVYDNFVWFTEDELTKAVREDVPSFDGTAPTGGRVPDLIAAALGRLLQSRSLPGEVDYRRFTKLDESAGVHIFRVERPAVKTCGLRFDGASAIPESDLLVIARPLLDMAYSRHYVENFSRLTVIQPYRQRGYWRAAFRSPSAAWGQVAGCSGALVTVRVDEGDPFVWGHAEWIGNTAVSTDELDVLLGFQAGEVADGSKIDAGLRRIDSEYRKIGYLAEKTTAEPILDDASRRATFRFALVEGPQFRMGTFSVAGLPPKATEALATRWKLKPGDVYDGSYLSEFTRTELSQFVTKPRNSSAREATREGTVIVDVTIEVK